MEGIEYIRSITNKRIKECIQLLEKGKKEEDRIFIEGKRLVEDCVDNQVKIEGIFIEERAIEKQEEFINKLQSLQLSIYGVSEDIIKKMKQTKSSQGVFAIAKKPEEKEEEEEDNIRILCDDVRDPGNMGSIIRTAVALGIKNIYLSEGSVNPYNAKVIRATMGGIFKVNLRENRVLREEIKNQKEKGYTILGTSLRENSKDIRTVKLGEKIAVIVGNEGKGIEESLLNETDIEVKIPMENRTESLNVGVATGMILWEILRNRI